MHSKCYWKSFSIQWTKFSKWLMFFTTNIRQICSIHNVNFESILLIFRERKLVRIYVQLTDMKNANEIEMKRSTITSKMIFDVAKKIFQSYIFSWKYLEWWAVYQISHTRFRNCKKLKVSKIDQRISKWFDDFNRIFLVDDAIHIHFFKAKQNISYFFLFFEFYFYKSCNI